MVARFLPNATSGKMPRDPIKATAYVQRGEATFIAVASWSTTTETFVLEVVAMPPPDGCVRGGGQWAGPHGPPRSETARRVEEDNGTQQ